MLEKTFCIGKNISNFYGSNQKTDKTQIFSDIYQNITELSTYKIAWQAIDALFIKRQKVVSAWHILFNSNQAEDETIRSFVSRLKQLTKNFEFNSVTAEQYLKYCR